MITLAEIKVKVKCPEKDGYFLRWYFNGWHSFFFVAGSELYETKGEWWNTQSKSKVRFGTAFLTQNEIKSIRTMLFAKRVEVLLKDGWKAIIVDSTSLKIEDTRTRGYKCEFTASIYAKVADYTPVKEIPIVEMDNVRITPENDIRITPEGDIRVVTSTEYDPIVSYIAFPTITRFVGEDIPLPNTATVTYKSGRVETLVVKWESVKNNVAGTFKVYGDVGSGGYAVVQEVVINEHDDLYWLRKIRDANPNSQLPSLWSEDKDPYTEWAGVYWDTSKTKVVSIDVAHTGFYDATHVSWLRDLETFNCSRCPISSIDVTKNTKLVRFICYNCPISSIDVTKNIELVTLDCINCPISSIDVTKNIELVTLDCSGCPISSIDVTKNIELVSFNCRGCELALVGITSKGKIVNYTFIYNRLPTSELDRLRALGFTDDTKLLPQK